METTKSFWLPEQASTFAAMVDWTFNLYLWIAVFFFALVIALMVLFLVKYRRRRPDQMATGQMAHNTLLETSWTVIPLLIVMFLFFIGMRGWWHMRVAPSNATTIDVTGMKWSWSFKYPQGFSNDTLVVPVNQPIRLRLTSTDVIHGFYIPAFRTKVDVVPGRYQSLWFEATKTGVFPVQCTQYCGTSHSYMLTAVKVVEADEYATWASEAAAAAGGDGPLDEFGARVFTQRGCNACHNVDGAAGSIGPTWKGLFDADRKLASGATVKADADYIRKSIIDPASDVVAGYPPVMPSYKGILSDREIDAIIAFIQTLK
jgi:cytochrome c oxidase subunit 2